MNGPTGPLSPDSIGGSEWSGISRYNQSFDNEPQYAPQSRGQLASPPMSSGSSGTMNGMNVPPLRDASASRGNPSPPASIARSSGAPSMYQQPDKGPVRRDEHFEGMLSEHYTTLKRFLAASLRDDKGNPRPNRARDKLLRLSPVQFQELSTDVFDELSRRQQSSRKGPDGRSLAPPHLLSKDIYHPKRNQARQKLSTLPPPRFRDLATDVFFELERRFPRFTGGDISRIGSPASSIRGPPSRSGNGTPVNGMRPPGQMRRPSDASSIAGYSIRSESRGRNGPSISGAPPLSPGLAPGEYGRPQPKTFQSNTIVPNKSTMVEDDGPDADDDDGDSFALENATRGRESKKSAEGSETDKKLIEEYQTQMNEMQGKLERMEDALKKKDDELDSALSRERLKLEAVTGEKQEWADLRRNLESKLTQAENLNTNMEAELERLRALHVSTERDLRAKIDDLIVHGGANSNSENAERENLELREQLKEQELVTDEVRREAQQSLREMRMLSEQSASAFNREEELNNHITRLEDDIKDWRNRYARTKTQLRSLRASSIGLTIQQDAAKYANDHGFVEQGGLVADVHVTKFQIAIDELLRIAREEDTTRVIEFMKSVVIHVRSITQDIDQAPPTSDEVAQARAKLKSRVSATANNLITASKNHAAAKGLSPVSLLDAAASHLTSAVVELVRTVKIRPTPAGELEDDDDGSLKPVEVVGLLPELDNTRADVKASPAAFLGLRNGRTSTDSSMYSPVNSPRQSTTRPRNSTRSSRGTTLINGHHAETYNKVPPAPMGMGFGIRMDDTNVNQLKVSLAICGLYIAHKVW